MKQIQDVTPTYVVIVTIMGIHLQLYDLLQLWGYIYSYMILARVACIRISETNFETSLSEDESFYEEEEGGEKKGGYSSAQQKAEFLLLFICFFVF